MPRHRFKVGQTVEYTPGRWSPAATSRNYKIVRLLPVEEGNLLYRIKSVGEMFERNVKESELALAV